MTKATKTVKFLEPARLDPAQHGGVSAMQASIAEEREDCWSVMLVLGYFATKDEALALAQEMHHAIRDGLRGRGELLN